MRASLVLLSVLIIACVVAGQSPVTLGVPMQATTGANQWSYWTLPVSTVASQMGATDKLFFSVTPFIGDADLYVSKSGQPTETECTHCIIKSASHFDEVKYIAKNDPNWPAAGQDTFFIGVHGYS